MPNMWWMGARSRPASCCCVVFGSKRLPDSARSLGRSLRILKAETKGLRTDDDPPAAIPPRATEQAKFDPYTGEPLKPPAPGRHPPVDGVAVRPDGRMPLVEHLYELRNRLAKSLLAIGVGMVARRARSSTRTSSTSCASPTAGHQVAGDATATLYVRDIFGQFQVRLRVAGHRRGHRLAAPVWLYQLGCLHHPGPAPQGEALRRRLPGRRAGAVRRRACFVRLPHR